MARISSQITGAGKFRNLQRKDAVHRRTFRSKMQGAVHRQPFYFHKYTHFIRLKLSQPKLAPVLSSAQAQEQGATF
jgi:hypothetical protein